MTPSPESMTTPVDRPGGGESDKHTSMKAITSKHSRLTLRIQRKNSLNGNKDAFEAITFKHDLAHAFSILEWIHGRFGKEDLSASGVCPELVKEGIVPQLHHILPVLDDSMLEWMRYL